MAQSNQWNDDMALRVIIIEATLVVVCIFWVIFLLRLYLSVRRSYRTWANKIERYKTIVASENASGIPEGNDTTNNDRAGHPELVSSGLRDGIRASDLNSHACGSSSLVTNEEVGMPTACEQAKGMLIDRCPRHNVGVFDEYGYLTSLAKGKTSTNSGQPSSSLTVTPEVHLSPRDSDLETGASCLVIVDGMNTPTADPLTVSEARENNDDALTGDGDAALSDEYESIPGSPEYQAIDMMADGTSIDPSALDEVDVDYADIDDTRADPEDNSIDGGASLRHLAYPAFTSDHGGVIKYPCPGRGLCVGKIKHTYFDHDVFHPRSKLGNESEMTDLGTEDHSFMMTTYHENEETAGLIRVSSPNLSTHDVDEIQHEYFDHDVLRKSQRAHLLEADNKAGEADDVASSSYHDLEITDHSSVGPSYMSPDAGKIKHTYLDTSTEKTGRRKKNQLKMDSVQNLLPDLTVGETMTDSDGYLILEET